MAGADPPGSENLKGLSKYFNSQTKVGRANVAKATYAAMGILFVYLKFRKPKDKQ